MTKKNTKRSLLLSALSLLMCVSMLIGSTFAWFTDSVTSGVNTIQAGNLDIELYYGKDAEPATSKVTATTTDIFTDVENKAILWEPGAVAYTNLNVKNEGSLALKYQLAINFTNENYIVENGAKLSEVLKVAFLDAPVSGTREQILAAAQALPGVSLADLLKSGTLQKKGSEEDNKVYGVVIYWEPSADDNDWNVYNGRTLSDGSNALHIDLGISLIATQLEAEFDSFGSDYDKNAWGDGFQVYSAADLQAAINNGETDIKLMTNINATEAIVIPEDATVTLNLNGATLNMGAYYIQNEGALTVANGTIIADSFNNETAGAPLWNAGGTLTVEEGAYISGICAAIRNEGTATINGGNLEATCTLGYTSRIIYNKSGTLTINGGTFDGCHSTNPSEGCPIVGGYGETVIYDGYFTDFSCTPDAIFGYSTNTTVKGGTYNFVPYDGWTAEQSFTKNGYLADGYKVIEYNGSYIIVGQNVIATTDALVAAINAGATEIELAPGNFTMPTSLNGSGVNTLQGKTLTIKGTRNTVIEMAHVDERDQYVTGATLTFEGVTLNFGTTNYMGFANTASLTYKDCAINGLQCSGTNVVFEDCDLNSNGAEHCVWTWGAQNMTFTRCDFTYTDRAVNCYGVLDITTNATFTNCTFTKVAGAVTTGAIETNSSTIAALNLTINNCTVNEGELWWVSIWDSKNGANTTAYVDGKLVAYDGAHLQTILDKVTADTVVYLAKDTTGTVVVDQPGDEDINIIIDGDGHKFDGQFKIQGNSDFDGADDDSLVIRNINFETSTAGQEFIWSNDSTNGSMWRYAHNVTVEKCTFTANGDAEHSAIGVKVQQAYNITVKNCIATNMRTLLQAESCGSTVTVDTCKVINGKNGVSFNNTTNAVIKNTEIEAVGDGSYGIRHKGEVKDYALTVENCTIKAFVPVLIRNMTASGYTATFSGTNTLTATNTFGYQVVLTASDWDDDASAPTAPTGTYTLTGADSFSVFQG